MAFPQTPAWVGSQMLEPVDNQIPKGLDGSNIKFLDEDKWVVWWELWFNTVPGHPNNASFSSSFSYTCKIFRMEAPLLKYLSYLGSHIRVLASFCHPRLPGLLLQILLDFPY